MKYYLKQCINFKVNVWRPLVAFVFLGSILTGCVDSKQQREIDYDGCPALL